MYRIPALAFACSLLASAQIASPAGTPAEMVVTVGHYYGANHPVLTLDNLAVTGQFEPLPITNLIPLRGASAGLDLFLLVDNCSNCEPGSKFEEIRRFIDSQPSTTAVGVAYIKNGRLQVAENPTRDRERAVKALNVPEGSHPSSPFRALTELIQGWPRSAARRVVLMISNGIDPAAGDALRNPSAESSA